MKKYFIAILQAYNAFVNYLKNLNLAAGICTIRGLKMTTKKKLCEIKGISDAKVDKVLSKIIYAVNCSKIKLPIIIVLIFVWKYNLMKF